MSSRPDSGILHNQYTYSKGRKLEKGGTDPPIALIRSTNSLRGGERRTNRGTGETEESFELLDWRKDISAEPSSSNHRRNFSTYSTDSQRERRLTDSRIDIEVSVQDLEYWKARQVKRAAKAQQKRKELDDVFEMKFSHSIQFNAVPEWSGEYIAYSNLKKMCVSTSSFSQHPNLRVID